MSQKKFFTNQNCSHFLKSYPTDFLYVDRGEMIIIIHANLWSFAS